MKGREPVEAMEAEKLRNRRTKYPKTLRNRAAEEKRTSIRKPKYPVSGEDTKRGTKE